MKRDTVRVHRGDAAVLVSHELTVVPSVAVGVELPDAAGLEIPREAIDVDIGKRACDSCRDPAITVSGNDRVGAFKVLVHERIALTDVKRRLPAVISEPIVVAAFVEGGDVDVRRTGVRCRDVLRVLGPYRTSRCVVFVQISRQPTSSKASSGYVRVPVLEE